MYLLKVICFVFYTAFAESFSQNRPDITWTCNSKELTVTVAFKNPFNGVVFARNSKVHPNCSSPNMPAPITREVVLKLPLLKCGNKVRNLTQTAQVRNTIVVQYHPLLSTEVDIKQNITCLIPEKLPTKFWESHTNKSRKTRPAYKFWVDFKYGPNVFGEREAELLEASNKLFIVAYVKNGGKHRNLKIRKCISHDDQILGNRTSVQLLMEANDCADSLSEFSLKPNVSVSDLVAFAEVPDFNIKRMSKRFVTCAVDLCKTMCPYVCPGKPASRWTSVKTHQINKRSTDQVTSPGTVKDLERRNNYLRMTLRALSEKLLTLKREQEVLKNQTEQEKSNTLFLPDSKADSFEDTTTTENTSIEDISSVHTVGNIKFFETSSSEENIPENTNSAANTKFPLQSVANISNPHTSTGNSNDTLNVLENIFSENEAESATFVAEIFNQTIQSIYTEVGTVVNKSLEALSIASVIEAEKEKLTELEKNLETSMPKKFNEFEKTEGKMDLGLQLIDSNLNCTNCSMMDDVIFTTTIHDPSEITSNVFHPMFNITDEKLLVNSFKKQNNTGNLNTDMSTMNLFKNEKLFSSDYISKFKFTIVTSSLSIFIVCFFCLSIGLYLTLRKERKKHTFDSLLLYSPF